MSSQNETTAKRIVLFIDHLGSGGAQRQVVMLAIVLKQAGFDVCVLVYHPLDFFRQQLDQHHVQVSIVQTRTKIGRILAVRKALRQLRPDVVIAYLDMPNLLAELAGFPNRKWKLVVSERTGKVGSPSRRDRRRVRFHKHADRIVVNSAHLKSFIEQCSPGLEQRVVTIHNCVDLEKFKPAAQQPKRRIKRLVVVARIRPEKNPTNLIRAVDLVRQQYVEFELVWIGERFFHDGKPTPRSQPYLDAVEQINELGLENHFRFQDPQQDVVSIYQSADAACLASHWEGFSNSLAEAIACGRPVIASDVCDNGILARPNVNGFLFDPADPEKIAKALLDFLRLEETQAIEMGRASRRLAESLLATKRFRGEYLELIEQLTSNG